LSDQDRRYLKYIRLQKSPDLLEVAILTDQQQENDDDFNRFREGRSNILDQLESRMSAKKFKMVAKQLILHELRCENPNIARIKEAIRRRNDLDDDETVEGDFTSLVQDDNPMRIEVKVRNTDSEEITDRINLEFDVDGWLKVITPTIEHGPVTHWSDHYPINLVIDPTYLTEYARYGGDIELTKSLPPEAIIGIVVLIGENESKNVSSHNPDLDLEEPDFKRDEYQSEGGELKTIPREALIRWLRRKIIQISDSDPGRMIPIYDADGSILFPMIASEPQQT